VVNVYHNTLLFVLLINHELIRSKKLLFVRQNDTMCIVLLSRL